MAVEQGDWVRTTGQIRAEGEVEKVRGGKVTIDVGWTRVTVAASQVRITTRPQTGLRRGR